MSAALSLQIHPSIIPKRQACAVSLIFSYFSSFCPVPFFSSIFFYVRSFHPFFLLFCGHVFCFSVFLYFFPFFFLLSAGLCVSVYYSLFFLPVFFLSTSGFLFPLFVVFGDPLLIFFCMTSLTL